MTSSNPEIGLDTPIYEAIDKALGEKQLSYSDLRQRDYNLDDKVISEARIGVTASPYLPKTVKREN